MKIDIYDAYKNENIHRNSVLLVPCRLSTQKAGPKSGGRSWLGGDFQYVFDLLLSHLHQDLELPTAEVCNKQSAINCMQ
uniref:Uncharacterized protein n=1 Tax=Anguilla anguilla TaxID=7936 RepID=A0A0E9R1U9_ANGAN